MNCKKAFFKKNTVASALILLFSSNVANALTCDGFGTGYCLNDGNSKFSIDTIDGNMNLTTDGRTQIFLTDFLVDNRALVSKGKSSPAYSFVDYYAGNTQTHDGSGTLTLTNLASAYTWASIDITFTLQGGATGSDRATLIETFTITNTSGANLDLSMIAYTDVQLGGYANGFNDMGSLWDLATDAPLISGNPDAYKQWSNNPSGIDFEMLASVDVAPDKYEVNIFADCIQSSNDLCYRVYNGLDTMLPNTVNGGPDDLAMAAQWLRILPAGGSFSYTQTMQMAQLGGLGPAVPVPAAAWLFGSGLIGLVGIARRKRPAQV